MPETALDPGYGVRPILDRTDPVESRRFTTDYYNAMLTKFEGDRILAGMAYNGGPGNIDQWIQAGSVPNSPMLKTETWEYPGKIAKRLGSQAVPASATIEPGTLAQAEPPAPQFDTSGLIPIEAAEPQAPAEFDVSGLEKLPEPLGVFATAGAVGKQLYDAAMYHIPGAFAAAMEGTEDVFAEDDWKDWLIERSRVQTQKSMEAAGPERGTAIPGVGSGDIAQSGASFGFSGVAIGAGLVAGVGTALGVSAIATPAAGVPAAYFAGSAATFYAALRMAGNMFVRDIREAADLDMMERRGTPMTDEEFQGLADELAPLIHEYGLWEAVPETVGNVVGFGILKVPIKMAIGRIFGKSLLQRIVTKTAAVYGVELATETVTGLGQGNVELDVGLREGPVRSFTSVDDVWLTLKEVAPAVFLVTTIMGGGTKLGIMVQERLKREGLSREAYEYLQELNTRVENTEISVEAAQIEALQSLSPSQDPSLPAAPMGPPLDTSGLIPILTPEQELEQARAEIVEEGTAALKGEPPPAPTSEQAVEAPPPEVLPEPPGAPVVPSEIGQPPGDSALAYTDLFGDSADAKTLQTQGFDALKGNRQHVMVAQVRSRLNDQQILRAIVEAVPVDVMNMLVGAQVSAQDLAHDPTVLAHRLAVPRNVPIPQPVSRFMDSLSSAIVSGTAIVRAKEPLLGSGSEVVELLLDTGATVQTGGLDDRHGAIEKAAAETDTNPTEAQKEAGNYRKGSVWFKGLDIAIENPRGSTRSGVDPDGTPWSVQMQAHYGYIKRTEGADGEQVDVYIGLDDASDMAYIVDQIDPKTGKFDEHKVILGASNMGDALFVYDVHFSDNSGPTRRANVSEISLDEFKEWLKTGNNTKPYAEITPPPAPAWFSNLTRAGRESLALAAGASKGTAGRVSKMTWNNIPDAMRVKLEAASQRAQEAPPPAPEPVQEPLPVPEPVPEPPAPVAPVAPPETIPEPVPQPEPTSDEALVKKFWDFMVAKLTTGDGISPIGMWNMAREGDRISISTQMGTPTGIALSIKADGTIVVGGIPARDEFTEGSEYRGLRAAVDEFNASQAPAEPPAPAKPTFTVKKAAIIPTRAGVVAVPISEETEEIEEGEIKPEKSLISPVAPGEGVQPDMFGGPDITEQEMRLRDEAADLLREERAEGLDDVDIVNDAEEQIDRLDGLAGRGYKIKVLREMIRQIEHVPAAIPMKPDVPKDRADTRTEFRRLLTLRGTAENRGRSYKIVPSPNHDEDGLFVVESTEDGKRTTGKQTFTLEAARKAAETFAFETPTEETEQGLQKVIPGAERTTRTEIDTSAAANLARSRKIEESLKKEREEVKAKEERQRYAPAPEMREKVTIVKFLRGAEHVVPIGGPWVSNGHWAIHEDAIPALTKRANKHDHVRGSRTNPVPMKAFNRILAAAKKAAKAFRPVALHTSDAIDTIIGQIGNTGKLVQFDARYFYYLKKQGIEVRANAGIIEKKGPAALYKDGKFVGALMPIEMSEADISAASEIAGIETPSDDTQKLSLGRNARAPDSQAQDDLFAAGASRTAAEADRGHIAKALQARLKRLGIADKVALRVSETLEATVKTEAGGKRQIPIAGRYSSGPIGLIEVALRLQAGGTKTDAVWVLSHETVHILREYGLIGKAEWATLAKAAKADTERMKAIREERKGQGDTEEQIVEEVVANMFADWVTGDSQTGGAIRRAFRRVRDFFVALRATLTGAGYNTVEDIYGAIERGEVGRRKARAPKAAEPKYTIGTKQQRETIGRIMDSGKGPLRERLSEFVTNFKDELMNRLIQHGLDQFDKIKTLERAAFGKIQMASHSAYKAARMTQNLHSVMGAVLRHGPLEFKDGVFQVKKGFEGGFEEIFADIAKRGEIDLWSGYAIANRSQRLIKEDREHLLSQTDIDVLLDQEPERKARFDKALKTWAAFNKAMLDMAEEVGLIDSDSRAIWENDDWVPFYRVLEDSYTKGPLGKRGIANQRAGIRRLKGGKEKIGDLIENMVMNMTHLVDASMKNEAARRTVEMIEQNDLMDGILEPVGKDWEKVVISPSEAIKALKEIGVETTKMSKRQRESWLKLFTMKPPLAPDVISVMADGKAKYYRVLDPMLLSSLTSLGSERVHWLMKVLGAPKRVFTVSITSFPGFMAKNLFRDSLHNWVISGKQPTPGMSSMRGLVKSLREDDDLVSIMAAGGGSGGFYRTDPEDVKSMISASRLKAGSKGYILDTPRKAWMMWRKIGQATENANRIALYEAVLKDTGDKGEAAFQALDIMDFSMRGDAAIVRFLIGTVPFMNARMQGLYRLGRGAKDNPKTFFLRGSIIAGLTLALMAINDDDDRYDDLPPWEKDVYYHIYLDLIFPKAVLEAVGIDASDWHLKLPKPFEVGAVFSTIPELMWRWQKGQIDGGQVVERLGAMFRDTFSMDMPQFIKPLIEQAANRIYFIDAPIVSERLKKLAPEAQFTARTSKLARVIAEGTPDFTPDSFRSPKRIEALARGYLGTLGKYIMAAGDAALALTPLYDDPERPTMRGDRIPELGSFIRQEPLFSTRWITEFYDLKREIETLHNTFNAYRKSGNVKAARGISAESPVKLSLMKDMRKAGKQMAKINGAIRAIENSRTMKADEKRTRIDSLYKSRAALAKSFVKAVNRVLD